MPDAPPDASQTLAQAQRHVPDEPPERVVSLLASATETLCALGHGDRLVGRSHECDFPAWVRDLPKLTEPKLDVDEASGAVDEDVKELLRQALSIYRVDVEALRGLAPDLILTQDHCEVCAVSMSDVERALEAWTADGDGGDGGDGGAGGDGADRTDPPRVVSTHPDRLADVFDDMRRIAEALGDPDAGDALVRDLKAGMMDVAGTAKDLDRWPTVCAIEWIDPLMVGGNWMPELIDLAGGKDAFGTKGEHSPYVDFARIVGEDPDVIVVVPCGFDLDRTRQELDPLLDREGFDQLTAVREDRVFLLDGLQFFNRPGPRLVESVEILADVLHPDVFDHGHEGTGWQRLDASG